jgi:hypothetical protein
VNSFAGYLAGAAPRTRGKLAGRSRARSTACPPLLPLVLPQIGQILMTIYLVLIIIQIIVNLKNKPESVEKVSPPPPPRLPSRPLLHVTARPSCQLAHHPAPLPRGSSSPAGTPLLRGVLHALHARLHSHHHLVSTTAS